ncbi:MAG: FAD-dependent oxidoreductase [Verrucomicrobiae bacterium]
MNRRQFIGRTGSGFLLLLASPSVFANGLAQPDGEFVFLEAEQFADLGGWDLDQQSMDQMGSPYLLAHGLGIPVKDAVTQVTFPSAGNYRVWVRTRDWVAPWKAPGAPGKFQLLLDGQPLQEIFGTKNADWHWHDGGVVSVGAKATVALHDLTGFEGRCEAILFCKDASFEPTNDVAALTKFRRALLGLPEHPDDGGEFDLVVVGGGLAGTCAALSAARNGLRVALVQDRPVLGGNCSSEVRVWPEGHTQQPPYPHIGEIVDEICPQNPPPGNKNAKGRELYDDPRKMAAVQAEPRITLLAEQRAVAAEMTEHQISAVIAQHTRTARQIRLRAKFFADCTGDASIGFLAGADFEMSKGLKMGTSNLWNVLDAADEKQVLQCECKDKDALFMCMVEHKAEQPFPRCPWAIDLTDKPFPGRKKFKGKWGGANPLDNLGGWFWESGFDKDPTTDIERIRDLNFRAMYGAWDALKNVDKLYPNHRLGWAAFIAGKRESRRLMGDVIVSADDFRQMRTFPDGAFPCTWSIDLHAPDPKFSKGLGDEAFIADSTAGEAGHKYKGPYWAPYRCLYSRNIGNLFMAGRDISVTNDGLGPVRVMRTCGMMGEIVGKAAAICVARKTTPRGVYETHLAELQEKMCQPGKVRV